ncbi:mitochondrial 54S ribosomal protein mL41 Ecym_6274 [Eremothecium cymbalariae DBVPG|uniref:54S ribosomal protein L27, mitochondrial n=1 Tax=Eremothecium cymbalariae (strain CBS 270.75 / DBVPG 7215 / KCTC 17166 / NRRL Y-17582) TaxID=931890 RepID=G8JVH6_ERECY|nr:hypothetical protein Ecym_6274 [Eremothecium cymbalariae DBVPG\
MRSTFIRLFHASPTSLLTRPWQKFRDGSLFYGQLKSGNKRFALTTKDGNKTMYKGTRSSGIGKHTRYGGYTIKWARVRTFVTPTNYNRDLKPLVSHNLPELRHHFSGYSKGPLDTRLYFDKLREYVRSGKIEDKATDPDCYVERG